MARQLALAAAVAAGVLVGAAWKRRRVLAVELAAWRASAPAAFARLRRDQLIAAEMAAETLASSRPFHGSPR